MCYPTRGYHYQARYFTFRVRHARHSASACVLSNRALVPCTRTGWRYRVCRWFVRSRLSPRLALLWWFIACARHRGSFAIQGKHDTHDMKRFWTVDEETKHACSLERRQRIYLKQPQSEELKAQAKWDLKVHLCRAWEVIRVYNVVNRKGRHKLQAIQDLSRGEA